MALVVRSCDRFLLLPLLMSLVNRLHTLQGYRVLDTAHVRLAEVQGGHHVLPQLEGRLEHAEPDHTTVLWGWTGG